MSTAPALSPRPRRALRPFIKWPGGKSAELGQIFERLPGDPARAFRRYYEPFCGGAALFFALNPQCPAYLNDASAELVSIYRHARDRTPSFARRLAELVERWHQQSQIAAEVLPWFERHFTSSALPTPAAKDVPVPSSVADALLLEAQPDDFELRLRRSLANKIKRVRGLEAKHAMRFAKGKLAEHCETAVRSALYTHLRDKTPHEDPGVQSAEFFFVREMCYGAMFRFGPRGNFNIPYGGIAYNRKDFARKVAYLLSDEMREALARCEVSVGDFEGTLGSDSPMRPGSEDFVFLDPPYDSDFKNYGPVSFVEADQRRLAGLLAGLDAHWMLVIKETPLIREIYEAASVANPSIQISHFDNRYAYNVRGRNKRDVVHLMITHRLG